MRRIKRTKITVIRTETIFLKMQDGANADYARELLKLETHDLDQAESDPVLEIEAIKNETDSQGEVE